MHQEEEKNNQQKQIEKWNICANKTAKKKEKKFVDVENKISVA